VEALAERMRMCIEQTMSGSSKRGMKITISVGGIMLAPQHPDVETLIDEADKALYEAKELGRNRVVMR